MRIIKEGKAPEITFTCKICGTEFAEEAKNCTHGECFKLAFWETKCPICGQHVEYIEKNEHDTFANICTKPSCVH